ncbi:hypothetical protein [Neisseria elongata]|jgi:hypothetical protein|uniref:hypothetical protein n=1 Tax=Neisseria elongata TaxID=495 RepID=UPI0006682687|nr:hypothetical protein [Neisseria elongata]
MENEKDQIGYEYKMGDYERIAQRFIIPMYLKDYDDSIQPSSSATMIKYFNSYFLIFAAHAVAYKEENLKKIGCLKNDGEFEYLITKHRNKYSIYEKEDIVIFECHVPDRNYFDLDDPRESIFLNKRLCWIGFPVKDSISLHRSKQKPEKIREKYLTRDSLNTVFRNANFYLLQADDFNSEYDDSIVGSYTNKNLLLKVAGFKPDGISLKGMSGGAMFFSPCFPVSPRSSIERLNKKFDLNDFETFKYHFYQFAGIGLEYKNGLIKGISKNKLKKLINDFIQK